MDRPSSDGIRTLDLMEAAAFLKMHPEEVRSRARRGVIPGAKAGRRWVFIDVDLVDYLRSLYARQRQALRVTPTERIEKCHSAKEEKSGGSISRHHQANEYDDLLKQKTSKKPKSFTTS